jgi:hypothetical protein
MARGASPSAAAAAADLQVEHPAAGRPQGLTHVLRCRDRERRAKLRGIRRGFARLRVGRRHAERAKAEIREAIEFHLEGMREDGLPIPKPSSRAEHVEVGEPGYGDDSIQSWRASGWLRPLTRRNLSLQEVDGRIVPCKSNAPSVEQRLRMQGLGERYPRKIALEPIVGLEHRGRREGVSSVWRSLRSAVGRRIAFQGLALVAARDSPCLFAARSSPYPQARTIH